MPVIDFRARPNTAENMKLYTQPHQQFMWKRWGQNPPEPTSLEGWVDAVKSHNIDVAVVTGRQLMAGGELAFGLSNDYIYECVSKYPGLLIGIAGIDMNLGADAVPEIERTVCQLGMRGICVDAGRSQLLPSDKQLYAIYEKAAELNVPIIVTIGPFAGKMHDPDLYDQITADFPSLNFVFSHAGFPSTEGWLGLAYRRQNVYLEPSIYWTMPGTGAMFEAANDQLQDQILYASAFPFAGLNSKDRLKERFNWTDESWRKFTYENAAGLLRLDQTT